MSAPLLESRREQLREKLASFNDLRYGVRNCHLELVELLLKHSPPIIDLQSAISLAVNTEACISEAWSRAIERIEDEIKTLNQMLEHL